jgi:hypothetical protein
MWASNLNPKSELHRLLTFKSPFGAVWPRKLIKPEDLAANGFAYTGIRDVVACVFCGLSMEGWRPSSNPQQLHKHWSPNCCMVTGAQSQNVPIKYPEDKKQVYNYILFLLMVLLLIYLYFIF